MWPMLLNMTHDECRRTLRRLELEAYSSMMSVFRAQGELEDNRKKLLEDLRAVLHISGDRHNAEARRVSNDELLATIAEQLAGSNTALGWISEGRRRVPLMPRGIPQTMYTELADKAAEAAVAENKEIKTRVENEKLVTPKSNEEEMPDPEGQTAEAALQTSEVMDELLYPPIAMEDHTATIWETELICRKRKIPEGGTVPEEAPPPIKNMRNIPVNTNQKHLNLSQVYSRFSQPATGKSTGHSKHSYNQVSKVSTSKSSQPHAPRAPKQRAQKQSAKASKAQKKNQEPPMSPSKQYPVDYAGPPGSFQASYAQSILSGKTKVDYDDLKPKVMSSPGMMSESPTVHLLTQSATAPHELADSLPDDTPALQAQAAHPAHPAKQLVSSKPCHLIVKKRGDAAEKKVQMSEYTEFKVVKKPTDEIKLVTSRPSIGSPNPMHRSVGTPGKLVTTKVVSSLPKPRTSPSVLPQEKMIVVSKSSIENRLPNSRIVITSSAVATPSRDSSQITVSGVPRGVQTSEALTPKGIPATDLKVSAKTFVLNPKSGQKMVVVPAKANKEGQLPLFHFKGVTTAMKLVSVTSQSNAQFSKPTGVTCAPKPTIVNPIPSNPKIVGVEPIKTANMADIVPVKGLPTVSTPKITNPIVRPVNSKGNLIVVQKGATLGKTLTFSKTGNDVSKIIMGKNVNKLLQSTKPDQVDPSKSGNIIVLELNNEQTARTTTMSEILDSRNTNTTHIVDQNNSMRQITQDTPVLFEAQITPETCNNSSLDSTTSLQEMDHLDSSSISLMDKSVKDKSSFSKGVDIKDTSCVTDWEMDMDTSGKSKDVDKLNSLHLDLGMSSDSENEYIVDRHKTKMQLPVERIQNTTPTDSLDRYSNANALTRTTRTLLSQLQDDGSSSNDSSFAIKAKAKVKDEMKLDKSESEALSKARAKLSEKVAEAKSQQKRIDVYSTAITTSDINLDSFAYLEESIMAADDEFPGESKRDARPGDVLADQLSRLLGEDSANSTNSTDSHTVSQMPLHKNEQ
ncbi:BRCA2-interacting transcriptional repressor EMSY isoform X2 [Bicyclus anynana]|uniref:BRCA2-interacting transcriptional repressor EMSY isoform X2 n=1 Tax=Bicyclus anynana TaxID=110368 RepID=A0A6J1P2F0_BICAN|nr:BRCA2-interacting transcriptional repressor EMSY isoform X2 [Bicyclus anynana]